MVKYLIRRPIAVLVTFVAICIIGVIASGLLPISMLPDIKIPEITVRVAHDNTNALDLERSIVSYLRTQLMQVPGLDDLQSETRDNVSIIRLKFNYGTDIDNAFIEVNDKVDAAIAKMPREVRRPKIVKASATDLPVFYLNVTLKDTALDYNSIRFTELSEFVSSVLRKHLEQLPQVALVDISGITVPELSITPDEGKMAMLKLSFEQLRYIIEQNNIGIGGITVREGLLQYTLVFKNELRTVEDVKNILVVVNRQTYKLSDIAEVSIRQQGMYLSQGKPAICMAIIKSSDARINTMKVEVGKLIGYFRSNYPEIDFGISQDQTFLLNYSLGNLKQNLLQGCLLAILVMFLFIRDYRSPLIIAVSLPVTLVISLLFFYLFNISINIISLSGLILGVGMMIDNSIVVIDNILQHKQRGTPLAKAISDGSNEVIAPMISATLTTCVVFIPLIFLSGIAGALFYDQAIAIAIGQGTSLLVSITLAPVIFNIAHKGKGEDRLAWGLIKPPAINLEKVYTKGFELVFKNQLATFVLVVALLAAGAMLFVNLDKRRLPELPQHETICLIDWNEPIHADENRKRTELLFKSAKELILQSDAFIGEQQFILNRDIDLSPSETRLYLQTSSPEELITLIKQIASQISGNYPNTGFSFQNPDNPFTQIFSGQEEQLVMKISSGRDQVPDLITIEQLTKRLKESMPGVESAVPVQQQYKITLKPDILALYRVDPDHVYNTIRVALNKYNIGNLKSDGRVMPIIIGAKTRELDEIINTTFLSNDSGASIPLKAIITVEESYDYRIIYGGREGLFVPVPIKVSFAQTQPTIESIKMIMANFDGLDISFTGSYFRNRMLLSEMTNILLISVLLLFFILAAQFESLSTPWIILLEIPVDLAFVMIMLYMAGNSINIMSLIGFVVMGGIIINDSILKIDTINHLYRNGMGLMEAIKEGGHRRLKPIVMTSLTTMLAIAPQMFGSDIGAKLQLPLSLSIVGGLTIGTLISLYVIPLAYYHLVKTENYFRSIFKTTTHKKEGK